MSGSIIDLHWYEGGRKNIEKKNPNGKALKNVLAANFESRICRSI